MPTRSSLDTAKLQAFDHAYGATNVDMAAQTRGEFLKAFPLGSLPKIKLDEYVIGHQQPTFCTHVEAKTRPFAICTRPLRQPGQAYK